MENKENIEFAYKILNNREELDDVVVDEWMQNQDNIQLLNEVALQSVDSEQQRLIDEIEQSSRNMTLRWSFFIAVLLLLAIILVKLNS